MKSSRNRKADKTSLMNDNEEINGRQWGFLQSQKAEREIEVPRLLWIGHVAVTFFCYNKEKKEEMNHG